MVVHGHDTTLPVTMDDMILHCKAVARGARRPMLIGDLPFGSYEQGPEQVSYSGKEQTQSSGWSGNPISLAIFQQLALSYKPPLLITPELWSRFGGLNKLVSRAFFKFGS